MKSRQAMVLTAMRMEVEERGLELSITEGGKEEKSTVFASCSQLEKNFQECSNREGAGLATSVETLGVHLKTTTKQPELKEKATRKNCDVRFSIAGGVAFAEEAQENWCREVAEYGPGFFEKMRRTGSWHFARWRQMAAAAGKKESVSLPLFMEVNGLDVEEELSTMATLFVGGRRVG